MTGAKVKVGTMVGVADGEGSAVHVGSNKVEVGNRVAVFKVATAVAVSAAITVIDAETSAIKVLISSIDKAGTDSAVALLPPTNVPIGLKGRSEPESNFG